MKGFFLFLFFYMSKLLTPPVSLGRPMSPEVDEIRAMGVPLFDKWSIWGRAALVVGRGRPQLGALVGSGVHKGELA